LPPSSGKSIVPALKLAALVLQANTANCRHSWPVSVGPQARLMNGRRQGAHQRPAGHQLHQWRPPSSARRRRRGPAVVIVVVVDHLRLGWPTTNQIRLNMTPAPPLKNSLAPTQLNWCPNFSDYPLGLLANERCVRVCVFFRQAEGEHGGRRRPVSVLPSTVRAGGAQGQAPHLHHWTIYTPQFMWLDGGGQTRSAVDHFHVTYRASTAATCARPAGQTGYLITSKKAADAAVRGGAVCWCAWHAYAPPRDHVEWHQARASATHMHSNPALILHSITCCSGPRALRKPAAPLSYKILAAKAAGQAKWRRRRNQLAHLSIRARERRSHERAVAAAASRSQAGCAPPSPAHDRDG
jgi:hypothetical protein